MHNHLLIINKVNICQSCCYHLRHIRFIRKFHSVEATKSLVNALITSILDYCKSVLYKIPKYLILKVQHTNFDIQKSKWICTHLPTRTHITTQFIKYFAICKSGFTCGITINIYTIKHLAEFKTHLFTKSYNNHRTFAKEEKSALKNCLLLLLLKWLFWNQNKKHCTNISSVICILPYLFYSMQYHFRK